MFHRPQQGEYPGRPMATLGGAASKLLNGFLVEAGIEIIAFGIEPTLAVVWIVRSDDDDGLGLVDLTLD